MRLLVGFDGSDEGRDALELARVLASESGGSAVVATVLFGGPLPVDLARLDEHEAREAQPLQDEAREKLPGIEVETRAFGGASPGVVLTQLAEQEDFDAIVIGSPHRGPVGRVLLGSLARNLLNGAPRAVLVAPKGYAREGHSSFRTIAVAYDGTPEAKAALRQAEEIAGHSDATIEILTVVSTPVVATVPGAVGGGYVPQYPPEPEQVISEAVASIDPRIRTETRRLEGSPVSEIAAKVAEEGVDLLVTGSRRYGPVARVLLGSVSRRLAEEAPCPVLVVPRP
jgi:nucleotide-binding universal stress UspA family protein